MVFSYDLNPRAQWIFDSPNHFATILGMVLLLVGGFWAYGFKKLSRLGFRRTLITIVAGTLAVGCIFALLRTYSRGGWVAFLAGLFILLASFRKYRRVPILFLGIFLTLLSVVPSTLQRTDPNALRTDKSIGNRILVWEGALAMTAENWLDGVGEYQFGKEFTAWYQPVKMNTRYFTAVNNYLTISAEYGIFAFWGYLVMILWILIKAWRKAYAHQHAVMLGILSSQAVYLISGIFTFSLFIWEVAWLFWLLFVITAIYAFKIKAKDHMKSGTPFQNAFLISTVISVLLLATGFQLLAQIPTKSEFFTLDTKGRKKAGVIVRPIKTTPQGVILWNHGKGGSIQEDGRDTLRYLAEKGFIVVSIDYKQSEMEALQDLQDFVQWALKRKDFEPYPIYIAGFSLGARLSILIACEQTDPRIQCVATIGSAASWPFPELSPKDHLYDLKYPLLIIHGEDDQVNSVDNAYQLEKLCKRYRKPCELFVVKNGSHNLGEEDHWFTALDRISDFLKKHPKK